MVRKAMGDSEKDAAKSICRNWGGWLAGVNDGTDASANKARETNRAAIDSQPARYNVCRYGG